MPDDFLIRAFLAGVGLSLAAGPLGSFVVWRKMGYFGDATAHAAILGVALAITFSIPITTGALIVVLGVGLALTLLTARGYASDTALGVLAHSALAVGLVAISLVKGVRIDLEAFLFGDILTVDKAELGVIWVGAIAVVVLLAWRWSQLLTATINEELAISMGIDTRRENLVLTLALAVLVALALKIVGALLIAAMLIIPPAAARSLSRTPEQMAILAALAGMAATGAGLGLSYRLDTPAGPSIVAAAAVLFALSLLRRPAG